MLKTLEGRTGFRRGDCAKFFTLAEEGNLIVVTVLVVLQVDASEAVYGVTGQSLAQTGCVKLSCQRRESHMRKKEVIWITIK